MTGNPSVPQAPAGTPRSELGRLFRNRNFRTVYLAGLGSQSGGTIAGVAVIWIVFATTRSALDIAFVGIAELAASILFTLPSGVWVDRYDRTRLMVTADLLRAGAMGGLALIFFTFGFNLLSVLVVMFVVAGGSILFQPAEQTLFPMIVSGDMLADANGISRSSRNLVQIISSSLGGILVVLVGATVGILYNSMTFVISALLLYSVYTALRAADRKSPARPPRERRMGHEIVEGLRWLIHRAPGLWELSISALFLNFFSTIFWTFIVIYVVVGLHGSAATYGIFLAVSTAGTAAGSLLVGRTTAVHHVGKVWVLGYGVVAGASLLALAFATNLWLSFPLVFTFSLASGFAGNTWLTAAQLMVPSEVQGRYFALDGLLSWGVLPISQIVGSLLIVSRGITFTLAIAGLGLLTSGLLSTLGRNLWNLGAGIGPHKVKNPEAFP
jgi:hypothetical protein